LLVVLGLNNWARQGELLHSRYEDVDLATVKEILGQREIEMTFLRYSHLAPAHIAKAEDKLWGNLE